MPVGQSPHKYFTFCRHICSFTSMTTCFLLWWTYFFFLIYANDFWNYTHMCIFTNSTNAYYVLSDRNNILIWQQYFILHIFYHLCIPHWKMSCQELHSVCMYACMYLHTCTYIHIYLPTYIHTDTYMDSCSSA